MNETFRYTALKPDGSRQKGVIEAVSLRDAKNKLRGMHLIILQLEAVSPLRSANLRLSAKELTAFTSQLAQLLESNIPLFDSLEVLEDQADGEKGQALISAIKEKIQRGMSFSATIQSYPETFSPTYVAIVASGEAIGGLSAAMRRIATLISKDAEMKSRLVSALIYPIILTALLFLALCIMFFFVIPAIQSLFEGKDLPFFTEIIFSCSSFANAHVQLLGVGLAAIIVAIIVEVRSSAFRRKALSKMIHWPLVGPFLIKSTLAKFARTLACLLQGGSPLNIALEKAVRVVGSVEMAQAIQVAKERVMQGEMLSMAFDTPLFPKLFRRMILLGEETGRLDQLIEQVSVLYDDETTKILERITSLIQPILLMLFGILIGSTLLAILLPLSQFGSLLTM